MLGIFRVTGDSMVPVLSDGDFVLTHRVFGIPKVGSLVVVAHPDFGVVVKRVLRVTAGKAGEGSLTLVGENNLGVSSQEMGEVQASAVRGVVWWKVRRSRP
jgi:signal peptidase I